MSKAGAERLPRAALARPASTSNGAMLQAVVCRSFDGPASLSLEQMDQQDPGPGEIRIRVAGAGVNYADLMPVTGVHQNTPPVPFIPGFEVAGTVEAVGPNAGRHEVGHRVMAAFGHGGYAGSVICPATHAARIPDTLSFSDAATMPIAFGTGYVALVHRARLRPSEWLLVHGAGGNIGGGALQIGKLLGARTIATASGNDGCERLLALGADYAIDYRAGPIAERVRAITDGVGAAVIFDAVTGPGFQSKLDCLAREGRLVVAGAAGGSIPNISLMETVARHIGILGVDVDDYLHRSPGVTTEFLTAIAGWLGRGWLIPRTPECLPLVQASEVLERLASGRAPNKIVLIPDPGKPQTKEQPHVGV